MSWTLRTALDLGRVSNLPTVWTNTLAGMVLSGAATADWRLPVLLIAMSLAYTGGMFLNDAFDAEHDARERAERPIPSGKVSRQSVYVGGYAQLLVAVLLVLWCVAPAGGGGSGAVLASILLCAAIVLYNAWHKGNALSPLVMGLCRLFVYVTAGLVYTSEPNALLFVGGIVSVGYLIGLTYTAKQESLGEVRNLWPLLFLLAPIVLALVLLNHSALVIFPLVLLTAWLLVVLHYLKRRQPGDIPRAVVSMIAGISLMDAIFIAAAGNPAWVLLCLVGFMSTLALQRWISGT